MGFGLGLGLGFSHPSGALITNKMYVGFLGRAQSNNRTHVMNNSTSVGSGITSYQFLRGFR